MTLLNYYGFYCQSLAGNSSIHNLMPSTFSFPILQGHISKYNCASSLQAIHYKHVQNRTHLSPEACSSSCLPPLEFFPIQNALCRSVASLFSIIQDSSEVILILPPLHSHIQKKTRCFWVSLNSLHSSLFSHCSLSISQLDYCSRPVTSFLACSLSH